MTTNRMRRLTLGDWRIINQALALLEASADDPVLREGSSEAAFEARVQAVRTKVHEREGATDARA